MTRLGVNFPLRTSRYAEKRIGESGFAAVGITVGHPRFRLAYQLSGKMKLLAPERAWFALPQEEFESRYTAKLDAAGIDTVTGELTALFERRRDPSDRGLALLCFEDVRLPGAFCHRRLFASWFERNTGQPVPELMFDGSDP